MRHLTNYYEHEHESNWKLCMASLFQYVLHLSSHILLLNCSRCSKSMYLFHISFASTLSCFRSHYFSSFLLPISRCYPTLSVLSTHHRPSWTAFQFSCSFTFCIPSSRLYGHPISSPILDSMLWVMWVVLQHLGTFCRSGSMGCYMILSFFFGFLFSWVLFFPSDCMYMCFVYFLVPVSRV